MTNYLALGATACAVFFISNASPAAAASETILYSFCSQDLCADGYAPQAELVNVKGTFYGTAYRGGDSDSGVAFSLDPQTGAYRRLYSFCSQPECADGANPNGLTHAKGRLYGTTYGGGGGHCPSGCGTVFSIDEQTGAETVLYTFDGGTDGASPSGGLINVNRTLYGTTSYGGIYGVGTVFAINPNTGAESVVYSFQNLGTDGKGPAGLLDVNGTFYGTT